MTSTASGARRRGGAAQKARRQHAILSLVTRERLSSQEDIRARLGRLGIDATQSTISRDVEELGLVRLHDASGLRYGVPGEATSLAPRYADAATVPSARRAVRLRGHDRG